VTLWFFQWLVGMTYWFEKVRIFRSMVHYSATCPHLCAGRDRCIRWDRILYNYMSWLHIILHGYAHSLFNNVNNLFILFPILVPYATKSCDLFLKVLCVWAQSQHVKILWFLFESIFNNFILRLLELLCSIDFHLCFNYTVLI